MLDETAEAIARAFHADYVERELAAGGDPTSPSLRPWDELAPTLQRSNRDLAADVGNKLAAVDCELEPLADAGEPLLEFTADELAQLGPMEHNRWCADRRRDGWTWGPVRDVERRRHPDLVAWEALSEATRDKDRRAVRAIPRVLAAHASLAVRRSPRRRDGS